MDDWIKFSTQSKIALLIKKIRSSIDISFK